jgi:hypothetical protein
MRRPRNAGSPELLFHLTPLSLGRCPSVVNHDGAPRRVSTVERWKSFKAHLPDLGMFVGMMSGFGNALIVLLFEIPFPLATITNPPATTTTNTTTNGNQKPSRHRHLCRKDALLTTKPSLFSQRSSIASQGNSSDVFLFLLFLPSLTWQRRHCV